MAEIGADEPSAHLPSNIAICPRPWENASEVWVDTLRFPGARADADRPTGASSLSEAIRL